MGRRVLFFFQAEDGIRDKLVTGVQTCALPIGSSVRRSRSGGSRSTPLSSRATGRRSSSGRSPTAKRSSRCSFPRVSGARYAFPRRSGARWDARSEEHTSELQSLAYLVCRLLLEKKKKKCKIAS